MILIKVRLLFYRILLLVACSLILLPSVANALSAEQRKVFAGGSLYFDVESCSTAATDSGDVSPDNMCTAAKEFFEPFSKNQWTLEGWHGGRGTSNKLPDRCNNPGNINGSNKHLGLVAAKFGPNSYESGNPDCRSGMNYHVKFSTPEAGIYYYTIFTLDKLKNPSGPYKNVKTIGEYLDTYCPPSDNCDPNYKTNMLKGVKINGAEVGAGTPMPDISSVLACASSDPATDSQNGAAVSTLQPTDAGASPDLSSLPLREKLAQLLMPSVENASQLDAAVTNKVGGVFVRRSAATSLKDKIGEIQEANKTSNNPLLVSIDGEGGTVGVPIGSDPGPANELAAKSDEEVTQAAKTFGDELKGLGINMNLAPDADVTSNTTDGVIKTRSFSGDKAVVTAKAKAFANGLLEAGLVPTFKHFPGHGSATKRGSTVLADSHAEDAIVAPIDQLRTGDMSVFKDLASTPNSAIMTGQLFIPGFNDDLPATFSSKVIDELIRQELGYKGLVITDDIKGMFPATSRSNGLPDAVLKSIVAGNDIALFVGATNEIGAVLDNLEAAVTAKTLTEERIGQSLERIKSAKSFILNGAGQPAQADGCTCGAGGGSGSLDGSENEEKVFNYLSSGKDINAVQAAGIMGNMKAESHFLLQFFFRPSTGLYHTHLYQISDFLR